MVVPPGRRSLLVALGQLGLFAAVVLSADDEDHRRVLAVVRYPSR